MIGRILPLAWGSIAFILLPLAFAAPAPGGGEGLHLYPVVVEGMWGYIDNTGKVAVEPRFGAAKEFEGGLARIKAGSKIGYIDKTGRYVWKPTE